MKILHLMPFCPEPPIWGSGLRNHYLLKNLVARHTVTVVCFGPPDSEAKLREAFKTGIEDVHVLPYPWIWKYRRLGQLYAHWKGDSFIQMVCETDEMQATLDRLLSQHKYDIVHSELSMMGAYTLRTDAIKVLDAHNVEYDIYRRLTENARTPLRRWHYNHEYQALFRHEVESLQKQDAIFVTSARDKEMFDACVPGVPKYIVPNGVDVSFFTPTDEVPEPFSLVFTGMMGYVPNYDGMFYFLDEIFPLILNEIPQAKIYIVGNKPPKALVRRARANVVITGFVADVRSYVRRSSVYVVPLRLGGGTRLKVSEAMAMQKPLVTTSIGCEGIDVKHGETALIADTPEDFSRHVIELLRNGELRRRLVKNGFELARTTYEWSVIGEAMEKFYQDILRSTTGRKKGNM